MKLRSIALPCSWLLLCFTGIACSNDDTDEDAALEARCAAGWKRIVDRNAECGSEPRYFAKDVCFAGYDRELEAIAECQEQTTCEVLRREKVKDVANPEKYVDDLDKFVDCMDAVVDVRELF